MEDSKGKRDRIFKIFICFSVVLSMLSLWLHVKNGILLEDHKWWWKECACILRGIDSAEAIKQGLILPGIGELPESTSTLPWAKIMGIFLHGSFLPYKISCVYYIIINLLIFGLMLYLVRNRLLEKYGEKQPAIWGTVNILSSWYIVDWIWMGNNASIVCFLIICAICVMDRHEILAGCMLSIAMIKPQIVLPFYILWVLLKKWKMIGVSAGIVTVSWLASIFITGISPVRQLENLLSMRVEMEEGYLVYGIFDELRKYGLDAKAVLFMSMALGILVCFICCYRLIKYYDMDGSVFLPYIAPAAVSVFWCYKSQCDYNILMIIAVTIVEMWFLSERSRGSLLFLMIAEVVMLMKPFSVWNMVLAYFGVWERNVMAYRMNRLDLYGKTIWFLCMMGMLLKNTSILGKKSKDGITV